MKTSNWEQLSAWFNEWLAADAEQRQAMRARLAVEHPELVADADSFAAASGELGGFLETPALVLAARDLAEDEPLLSVDSMIGPYRLVSLLARGGMGDVYRATDVRLQRDVALKVLAHSKTGDPRRVERFMHEARVTASLDHSNVVRVYDVGRFGDRAYLVAELLEGETLRAPIARGPMPIAEVVRIAVDVTKGLAAAHAAGLVHRDLKPDNIFLTNAGATKILDFGIAKLAQHETPRDGFTTLTGVVLGTAGYLAPEQIRGEAIDTRADLFALGAVMFEMLTGTRAFAREHLVDTLHAILHDSPSPALARRDDVPPALVEVVLRLLEKSPERRFQSSTDLIAALENVPIAEAPPRPLVRWWHRRRRTGRVRHRSSRAANATRAAAALVATAIAAVAIWSYWWGPSGVTLAVMPFQSVPASGDNAIVELGLADAIISRLGQLPGDVRVLPLTATARLRDNDPLDAARQLGATHVLAMRLQREGGEIRATPQLLSTNDGRVVWATVIPAEASSMFTIQDLIVKQIVEQIAPRLSVNAGTRIARVGTRNNDAYQAYLRGRVHVLRPNAPDLQRAAEFFQQAVDLDPEYADAWASLGSAYKRMSPVAEADPAIAFPAAKHAAERALALDPQHAEALSVLGTVAFWFDWDYAKAETLLRRALELQPSSADAQLFLAHLLSNTGRHDEALEEIRRARALDLSWPLPRSLEGEFLTHARKYDQALRHLEALLEVEPQFWTAHVFRLQALLALDRNEEAIRRADDAIALRQRIDQSQRPYAIFLAYKGYALARLGRHDAAREVLETLRREGRERYLPSSLEALVLLGLRQDDEAMERLEAAVTQRDFNMAFIGVQYPWDDLRDNARFRRILSQVNLQDVSERSR